jgi:hypothetical protein
MQLAPSAPRLVPGRAPPAPGRSRPPGAAPSVGAMKHRTTIWLAALMAAAGCDLTRPDASLAELGLELSADLACGDCDEPTRFAPGVISSDREEWRITFSPDGRTAYWAVSDEFFPISRQATIVTSQLRDGVWSTPEVAPFSGVHSDIDPHLAPDGRTLFWSSIRPVDGVARSDADLWMVVRTRGGAWSEPVHLGAAINSPGDELYPSVDASGTLYFASDRAGGAGGWDIYRARRQAGGYGAAENLGAGVNTATWDFNPEISADGTLLLFTALDRPDGFGLGDLYGSRLRRGVAQPAVNLGPCINSELDEYHPTLSRDRRSLFFVRHSYTPWVAGDFYRVRLR